MIKNKTPKQGDVYYVDLSPTKGHEQAGARPVIVFSNWEFNKIMRMALVAPLTSRKRDYPTHLAYNGKKAKGYAMLNQIRAIDINQRDGRFVENIHDTQFINKAKQIVESFF